MNVARTTVSMPPDLLATAQAYCDGEGVKFSNYVEKLIRDHLVGAGKFPPDATVETLQKVRELISSHGADAVLGKLEELAMQAATAEAGGVP